MRRSIPVMEFLGKGRQMEDVETIEPTVDRQEAPTEAGKVTTWEAGEDHAVVTTAVPSKRWEQQEGPFRGFGSPPGRF
jgi:hypothetical protein